MSFIASDPFLIVNNDMMKWNQEIKLNQFSEVGAKAFDVCGGICITDMTDGKNLSA